jgi:hypothetical protein
MTAALLLALGIAGAVAVHPEPVEGRTAAQVVPGPTATPTPTATATPTGAPTSTAKAAPWTGPQSAVAKAEKSEVRLGEPFSVVVEIKHDPKEDWTLAPGLNLAPFVLEGQQRAEAPAGSTAVTRFTLKLALFKLGAQDVPNLSFRVHTAAGDVQSFSLPGPTVKGAGTVKPDAQRRDIQGPVPLFLTSLRWLFLGLGILAGLALIVYAVRWWRRRPKRAHAVPLTPPVPADMVALDGLRDLEAEGLPALGRFKEFHLRLSELLRTYLSSRFSITALDMTSSELLDDLARRPTDGLSLADMSWLTGQGDLAKFAKAQPSADDCKQALGMARQIVLRTRRPPPVAGTEAPGTAPTPGVAA